MNTFELQDAIAAHLHAIGKFFTQRPRITIVIRTPWLDAQDLDGGVVITDDDLDAAIAEIHRLRDRPIVGWKS